MSEEVKNISVVIAAYNGEKFVINQIESIACQLFPGDEIIIVDDCSSDKTVELITSLSEIKIKLIKNYINIGVQKSFERGLFNARNEYIFLSDQDDVWLDGKVKRVKLELEKFDLVVTDCIVVDAHLSCIAPSLFSIIGAGPGLIRNLYKNSYTGCCMAFNRKILRKVLPFPEKVPMHDWWIGLVGELTGSVSFIKDSCMLYRRHQGNLSTLTQESGNGLIEKIRCRLILLKFILLRMLSIK